MNIIMKKCVGPCGEAKPHTEEFFRRRNKAKPNLKGECRICELQRMKNWNAKNRVKINTRINSKNKIKRELRSLNNDYENAKIEKLKQRLLKVAEKTHKKCTGCPETKELSEFRIYKTKIIHGIERKYYKPKCMDCEKIEAHKEYEALKIQISKSPERLERKRAQKRKYERNRIESDEIYKLRMDFSKSVNKELARKGGSKDGYSCLDFLPYDILELKNYIESLFEPWMSWNNRGKYNPKTWKEDDSNTWKWQLDHIIPCSDFDYKYMYDEQFKQCWSLSNLRPLSAKQNILDGTRRTRHKKKK